MIRLTKSFASETFRSIDNLWKPDVPLTVEFPNRLPPLKPMGLLERGMATGSCLTEEEDGVLTGCITGELLVSSLGP